MKAIVVAKKPRAKSIPRRSILPGFPLLNRYIKTGGAAKNAKLNLTNRPMLDRIPTSIDLAMSLKAPSCFIPIPHPLDITTSNTESTMASNELVNGRQKKVRAGQDDANATNPIIVLLPLSLRLSSLVHVVSNRFNRV